jgi:hypothetical protein
MPSIWEKRHVVVGFGKYVGSLATTAKVSSKVNMEDFVHDYFSPERFKKAYEGNFKPMTSQEQ